MWFALLLACRHPDPAPEDVDGLARWFWAHYDDEDDAIAEAVANAHAALGADALEDATDGLISDLAAEDLATVGLSETHDPTLAAGMYLSNVFACELGQLEEIVYHLAQDELYEGVYDAYSRSYTSDFDAYVAREAPTLGWEVEISTSVGLPNSAYTEWLDGGVRYVPDSDYGPVLLARTWMPGPAEFEDPDKSFEQDYQIEVYWERAPGEIVHLYAIWRQIDLGGGLDQDSDLVVGTTLNNLAKWDEATAELCAEGRP